MSDYYNDLDRASELGRKYAESAIASGQMEPHMDPLNGEWAGDISPADIAEQLGANYDMLEDFERDDIADHWEDGYQKADWPAFSGARLMVTIGNGKRVRMTV